jgi:hypothetical protein
MDAVDAKSVQLRCRVDTLGTLLTLTKPDR